MTWLLSLFGCRHRKLSRAFTIPPRPPYQVCLDCGAEFAYDLQAMKQGEAVAPPRARRWNDGLEQKT